MPESAKAGSYIALISELVRYSEDINELLEANPHDLAFTDVENPRALMGESARLMARAAGGLQSLTNHTTPAPDTALKEVLRLMGAIREASNICNISISIAQGTHEKSLSAALDAGNEDSAHLITSAIESDERLELYAFRARVLAILGLLDDLTERIEGRG